MKKDKTRDEGEEGLLAWRFGLILPLVVECVDQTCGVVVRACVHACVREGGDLAGVCPESCHSPVRSSSNSTSCSVMPADEVKDSRGSNDVNDWLALSAAGSDEWNRTFRQCLPGRDAQGQGG
jgi:hypothetical protein